MGSSRTRKWRTERQAGREELTTEEARDHVTDAVEEEEFGDVEGFDEHGETGGGDGGETDDVDDADDVEDEPGWARQGLLEEWHRFVCL